jgi:hypothetical protein
MPPFITMSHCSAGSVGKSAAAKSAAPPGLAGRRLPAWGAVTSAAARVAVQGDSLRTGDDQ